MWHSAMTGYDCSALECGAKHACAKSDASALLLAVLVATFANSQQIALSKGVSTCFQVLGLLGESWFFFV